MKLHKEYDFSEARKNPYFFILKKRIYPALISFILRLISKKGKSNDSEKKDRSFKSSKCN